MAAQVVGVVGLGLIGGSIAKAYKKDGYTVYGLDKDSQIQSYAKLAGGIDQVITDENIGQCDLVFIALYPADTVDFIEKKAQLFKKGSLVIDCCGVKKAICSKCFAIAKENGFTFSGGHPMAGNEKSGFGASGADMFKGAAMVIVPPVFDDIRLLARIKEELKPLGFSRIKVTKADNHDRMIAYTSQLPHIASNAFIKSPSAMEEEGFSGGSFKDLTRIAYLNEKMWAELFMYNRAALTEELDILIESLSEYRRAIAEGDSDGLEKLLKEGRQLKEQLEKRENR